MVQCSVKELSIPFVDVWFAFLLLFISVFIALILPVTAILNQSALIKSPQDLFVFTIVVLILSLVGYF